MKNFNYEKFCEVYYSQIEPELLPLEQERKKVIGWIPEWLPGVEVIAGMLIILTILFIIFNIMPNSYSCKNNSTYYKYNYC